MRTRWLIALVSVVALLASACDSAQDEQPADTESDDQAQVDDGDVQQRLEDAVATTIEQGTADFTATSQRAIDAGSAAGTDTDRTTQVDIEGAIDFDQGLREMSLTPAGSTQAAEVLVMLDRDDLYVQLADDALSGDDEATGDASADDDAAEEGGDAATDEVDDDELADAQWARFDKDELVGVESRASQLLLHDPYPMLQALQGATLEVREGTPIGATDSDGDSVEDEGTTSEEDASVDEGLADQPDIIATIDLTETGQSALEALSKQMGSDELDIQVWVEPAVDDGDVEETTDGNGEENEVDERIQQLAISVPADAAGELGGATEGGSDVGDDDWELMIELTSFGSEVDIEAPEDDEIVETEMNELRAMLSGQRKGLEPTPTPDADDVDNGASTDS